MTRGECDAREEDADSRLIARLPTRSFSGGRYKFPRNTIAEARDNARLGRERILDQCSGSDISIPS